MTLAISKHNLQLAAGEQCCAHLDEHLCDRAAHTYLLDHALSKLHVCLPVGCKEGVQPLQRGSSSCRLSCTAACCCLLSGLAKLVE